jgi:hypothetical protein
VSKNPPSLSIATEKVCFIIIKARQFDVKDVVTDLDDASNATDDSMLSVLEDHWEDPVADEIRGFIGALNEDEQIDLVALAWLGRGEGTIDDWDELRAEAARITDHSESRHEKPLVMKELVCRKSTECDWRLFYLSIG